MPLTEDDYSSWETYAVRGVQEMLTLEHDEDQVLESEEDKESPSDQEY